MHFRGLSHLWGHRNGRHDIARTGQRCSAWRVRRCRRLSLVDSGGGLATVTYGAVCARRVVIGQAGQVVAEHVSVSVISPYRITLDDAQRGVIAALARRSTAPHRQVVRARIVLAAADGAGNAAIAAGLGIHVDTVRKWRRRFASCGMPGLQDADRPGRPPRFTQVQAAQVKALACELPAGRGVPLSRWSAAELADEAMHAGIVEDISASTAPYAASLASLSVLPGTEIEDVAVVRGEDVWV